MTPTFVTFKWKPFPGYRSTFEACHVNTLASMVRRNYAKPHRFVCVTDDAKGIDPRVETLPLWNDFADLMSPHGKSFPSCYRRLKIFSREARELFGERIAMLDLDAVIVNDMAPCIDRPEDFVAWGDTGLRHWGGNYNCSFVLLRTGSRPQVWEDFDPARSPQLAQDAKCLGSDQGWVTYCLGKDKEAKFRQSDGVYSYQNDLVRTNTTDRLPDNARIVFFHGRTDPWSPEAQRLPWVRQHYH